MKNRAIVPKVDAVLGNSRAQNVSDDPRDLLGSGAQAFLCPCDGVRREIEHYRGREIDTAGDGFFATFDGPARAIRCAKSIRDTVRSLGIETRIGLHTGECERIDDKVAGIAVHTGARVMAKAEPGEILVSSTVKDLVAGSGIEFDPRGEHELKGVPERWRLFAVRS